MVNCGSAEFCHFLLGLVGVLPRNFLKFYPVESERTIWCGMIADDCLPSGSSLYLSMLAEHTCVHFPRWWIRYSEDFTHLLTGSREDLVVFLSTPFLLILFFFLATTPFPSRIAKNIRGQMVVPCSRVLAFLLTVSKRKIRSSFPQILAFSPE